MNPVTVRPGASASEVRASEKRPGRLGVGVIGAGRVGAVLGSALRAAGHAVVGASAVSQDSVDRVDALLPGVPILQIPEIVERSELVLLTVPDDALAELVAGLAEVGAWQPGQLVVHTAGRYGWKVLQPVTQSGAIPLALHPAMTFTGTSIDVVRLNDACFGVTAPGPVLPIAQALVVEMGAEPVVIDEADRTLYHAALAHGANHAITLVGQALDALRAAGIEEPARVLGPLVHASVDNVLRRGDGALTGPVARGDAGTVRAHVQAFRELADRGSAHTAPGADRAGGEDTQARPELDSGEILAGYVAMARLTASRALGHGRLDLAQAEALMRELTDTL